MDDKIIHCFVEDNAEFDLDQMIEIREGNHALARGEDYCVLLEAGSFTDFSKKAKEASASNEHSTGRIALAIISNNLAMKILTDIYLRINKPVSPTKAFKSKLEALEWLKGKRDLHYLQKNSSVKRNAS
ncbi:MAG: hypothetical protein KDC84_14615 [Crocinitomicaceae bacterium]|nr:hypothetical protein [Crocinitomicaceae bacterium]